MEQQVDDFSQKRMEIMIDMATKKLQAEINSMKEHISSLNSEIGSLKSQITRIQFQPPPQVQKRVVREYVEETPQEEAQPQHAQVHEPQAKKEVKIVDCRPEGDRKQEFVSGAAKNSEPVRPRFGDYKSEDVSIDKFFYFGRK